MLSNKTEKKDKNEDRDDELGVTTERRKLR